MDVILEVKESGDWFPNSYRNQRDPKVVHGWTVWLNVGL